MTVSDIDNAIRQSVAEAENLIATQQKNEAAAVEYKGSADKAAAAGDLEGYKHYKALADDAEAVAYVCKMQLQADRPMPVTTEQTQEAWEKYAADYNKKIAARLKKFEALKADMLKEYEAAFELQKEACAVRERLAGYVSRCPDKMQPEGRLATMYPMEYIPYISGPIRGANSLVGITLTDANAAYYLACMEQDEREAKGSALYAAVGRHRAG